ncbi:hypothetical protein TNCV_1780551 [Trichonephila clavipes]|nr:hypothetical protein TNCV_1780551 [Trichonephila clavipes]
MRAQLIQVLSKFEERYSCREIQGPKIIENRERRDRDIRWMSNNERIQSNWRDAEVVHRPNDRRKSYRGKIKDRLDPVSITISPLLCLGKLSKLARLGNEEMCPDTCNCQYVGPQLLMSLQLLFTSDDGSLVPEAVEIHYEDISHWRKGDIHSCRHD